MSSGFPGRVAPLEYKEHKISSIEASIGSEEQLTIADIKRKLFVKILKQEFIRELQYFWDVANKRANQRPTSREGFRNHLIKQLASLMSSLPVAGSAVAEIVKKVVEFAAKPERDKRLQKLACSVDRLDLQQLSILLDIVSQEALRRYEAFIVDRLSDVPEEGVIPFARVGARRMLEMLTRTGQRLQNGMGMLLSESMLLAGLMEGQSGAFIDGYFNQALTLKLRKRDGSVRKVEAEDIYGRPGLRRFEVERGKLIDELFVRDGAPILDRAVGLLAGEMKSFGYVRFRNTEGYKRDPKAGYVLMPLAVIRNRYDYQLQATKEEKSYRCEGKEALSPSLCAELRGSSLSLIQIDKETVKKWLKEDPTKSLIAFVRELLKYPLVQKVICRDSLVDLSSENLSLRGCNLSHVDLSGATLGGDLTNTDFSYSNLIGATLVEGTQARNANFREARCEFLQASGVDFRGSDFTQAHCEYANFKKANFAGCKLLGVQWSYAQLEGIQSDIDLSREQEAQLTRLEKDLATQREALIKLQEDVVTRTEILYEFLQHIETGLKKSSAAEQPKWEALQTQIQTLVQRQEAQMAFEHYCKNELRALQTALQNTANKTEINQLKAELEALRHQIKALQNHQNLIPTLEDFSTQFQIQFKTLASQYTHFVQALAKFEENVQTHKEGMNQLEITVYRLYQECADRLMQLEIRTEALELQTQQLTREVKEIKQVVAEQKAVIDPQKLSQTLAKIASDMQPALREGRDQDVLKAAQQLMAEAKDQGIHLAHPMRVVDHLMNVANDATFECASLPLKKMLAETLHHYLDIGVWEMRDQKAIQLDRATKDRYFSILTKWLKFKDAKQVLEIQYALECAQMAINTLPNTDSDMQALMLYAEKIIQILVKRDIGAGLKLIKETIEHMPASWYRDVLLIRSLAPLAQQSLTQCRAFQQLLAEPRFWQNHHWQVAYTIQEVLHEIVMGSKQQVIQQRALLGGDPEARLSAELIPSLRYFAELAFSKPQTEAEFKRYYRVAQAIRQLRYHFAPWIQQEAQALYDVMYRAAEAHDKTLETKGDSKSETKGDNYTLLTQCMPQTLQSNLTMASAVKLKQLQPLTFTPCAWSQEMKIPSSSLEQSKERPEAAIQSLLGRVEHHLNELAAPIAMGEQKAVMRSPRRSLCLRMLEPAIFSELKAHEIPLPLTLLHRLVQECLVKGEFTEAETLYHKVDSYLLTLPPLLTLDYYVGAGDQYAQAGYPQQAAGYYCKAENMISIEEKTSTLSLPPAKIEAIKQTITQRLALVRAVALLQIGYPVLEQRLAGLDFNVLSPSALKKLLSTVTPLADHLVSQNLVAGVHALYTLLNPAVMHYQRYIVNALSELKEQPQKVMALFEEVQPVLQQWLKHQQFKVANPCYDLFLTCSSRGVSQSTQHQIVEGVARCEQGASGHQVLAGLPTALKWQPAREELQILSQQFKKALKERSELLKAQGRYVQGIRAWLAQRLQQVEQFLGEPPCGYAVLMMGSLAEENFYPGESVSIALLLTENYYRYHPYFQAFIQLATFDINILGDPNSVTINPHGLEAVAKQNEYLIGTPGMILSRFHPTRSSYAIDELVKIYQAQCVYASATGQALPAIYSTQLQQLFSMPTDIRIEGGYQLIRQQLAERYLERYRSLLANPEQMPAADKLLHALTAWCTAVTLAQGINMPVANLFQQLEWLGKQRLLSPLFTAALMEVAVDVRQHHLMTYHVVENIPLLLSEVRLRAFHTDILLPAYACYSAWTRHASLPLNVEPVCYNFDQLVKDFKADSQDESYERFIRQHLQALIRYLIRQSADAMTHRRYYHHVPAILKEYYRDLLVAGLSSSSAKVANTHILDVIRRHPRHNGDRLGYIELMNYWNQALTEKLTDALAADKARVAWFTPRGRSVERSLKPELQDQLMSSQHTLRDNHDKLFVLTQEEKPVAYARTFSPLPGIHQAVNALRWRLSGYGVLSTLVKFQLPNQAPYPLLLLNIAGPTLPTFLAQGSSLAQLEERLDARCFTLKVLETLMVGPGGEGAEQLAVEEFINLQGKKSLRLISLDSHHSLMEGLTADAIQLKSLVYCLNRMQSFLDRYAVEEWLSLHPSACLKHWLYWAHYNDIPYIGYQKERPHDRLFSVEEQVAHVAASADYPCFLPFALEPGLVSRLFQRFERIQQLLRRNTLLTHLDFLCAIEPQLGSYYRRLFDKISDPLQRFEMLNQPVLTRQAHQIQLAQAPLVNLQKCLKPTFLTDSKMELTEVLREEIFYRASHVLESELADLDEQALLVTRMLTELKSNQMALFRDEKNSVFVKQQVIRALGLYLTQTDVPEKQQRDWLKAMVGIPFQALELPYWSALTDELLHRILKAAPQLRSLDVRGCRQLTDKSIGNIASCCARVEELNLSDLPRLTLIKDSVLGFVGASLKLRFLRRLTLNTCENLVQVTLKAPRLQMLTVQGCPQLRDITTGNEHFKEQEKACIQSNYGGPGLCDVALLRYRGEAVQHDAKEAFTRLAVGLETSGYMPAETKAFIQQLKDIDEHRLTDVSFTGHVMRGALLEILTSAAVRSESLMSLNLSKASLDTKAIQLIAALLSRNSRLQCLDLSSNPIKDAGVKILAMALPYNYTLTKLILDNTDLSDEGIEALSRALQHNNTLQQLSLRGHVINARGIVALTQMLVSNQSMVNLQLEEKLWQAAETATLRHYLEQRRDLAKWTTVAALIGCCRTEGISKASNPDLIFALTKRILAFLGESQHPSRLPLTVQKRLLSDNVSQSNLSQMPSVILNGLSRFTTFAPPRSLPAPGDSKSEKGDERPIFVTSF